MARFRKTSRMSTGRVNPKCSDENKWKVLEKYKNVSIRVYNEVSSL